MAGLGDSGELASAELYDSATGTWTITGSLPAGRDSHTATLLPNGRVLVAGGICIDPLPNDHRCLTSTLLYDLATGTWAATGSLTSARVYHTATILPNGRVLVAGGQNNSSYPTSTEIYNAATEKWTDTGRLASCRVFHTATLLPNGKVLVVGGCDSESSTLASVEIYDPATEKWTATSSLTAGRQFHSATLLPNGKVLVAGGENHEGQSMESAELYDPATGCWTSTGSLAAARFLHSATLLPNGKVIVAGGSGSNAQIASAELYDPTTENWTSTSNLAVARCLQTATLLPNGKAILAGGWFASGESFTHIASAELYESDGLLSSSAVQLQPKSQSAYINTNVTFTVGVLGVAPLNFQWRKDGLNISGATNRSYSVIATAKSVGSYDVFVSNSYGEDTSETATLSLRAPVEITRAPHSTQVNAGSDASFTVDASGPGVLIYQWQKNGKNIQGANFSSLNVAHAGAASTGVYTCIITSALGKATTAPALLTVNDPLLLIYKIAGQRALNGVTISTRSKAKGYLVLDRWNHRAGFVWTTISGKQKIYSTDLREELATHSTGPVPKSTTVVVGDSQNGTHPNVEHGLVWLKGTDGLAKVSATDWTIAPLTMAGFINQLQLVNGTQIEALNVSTVLDKLESIASRSGHESVEAALARIGTELEANGFTK